MGYYINVPEGKGQWLDDNGEIKQIFSSKTTFTFGDCPEHQLPVILVDNGPFTAAGICINEREFIAFTLPDDGRPKILYFVDKVKLTPFLPGEKNENGL